MNESISSRKTLNWKDINFSGECKETHEFLDKQNIPHKKYSKKGLLKDEKGTYFLLPLIDRIIIYKNKNKKVKRTGIIN